MSTETLPVPTDSPLAEATVDSLDELFRRDPLKLTDGDVDKIVAELRRKRALWVQAAAEGKTRAPKEKAQKAEAKPEMDLSDII
jgi:hypothetical protein